MYVNKILNPVDTEYVRIRIDTNWAATYDLMAYLIKKYPWIILIREVPRILAVLSVQAEQINYL